MPNDDVKKTLDEIQASLDKLTPEEKLKFLQDLNQQTRSINQDMKNLVQMTEDENRATDLAQKIKES